MRYDRHLEARHLRKLDRVAIWNGQKIIILIAMGLWVADVTFLLVGEYPLPVIEVFLTSTVVITGAIRVNFFTFTILDLLAHSLTVGQYCVVI